MDYETVRPAAFGRAPSGPGLNLPVRDVPRLANFLRAVLGMRAHRVCTDVAILAYGADLFQLHSDATYRAHPLPSLLPEAGARGAGIEIRLYDTDPDAAAEHAATLLQPPADKPHGLRECVILCENGYAWVPGRPLTEAEEAALARSPAG